MTTLKTGHKRKSRDQRRAWAVRKRLGLSREKMRARLARPWPWDDGALTLPDIAARVGDGDDAGRALLLRYLHPEQP